MNERFWNIVIFWYGAIISLGLLFVIAYVCDNITPKELVQYVHRKKSTKKRSPTKRWRF